MFAYTCTYNVDCALAGPNALAFFRDWRAHWLYVYGITQLLRGCHAACGATDPGPLWAFVLLCVVQAGVSVTAWVFGHQLVDLVGLMLHPMLFFAWMYVLVLTPVPAWSYFTTLTAVSIYTSGLGYLVSGACRS